ncbi:hypothetical protein [Psychrobium sp. 1_MG-2023]|uniref:hypothetical protein n=1 Tax=Psychrobium sp. 1_MG-2023 TaxID=3062624 RepID=UPI00269D5254|nr:hypothetical protein [Psychrobium sp. 1_MG-2023]MDP2562438.1 hypothetical protein [Psychrobium sp. 1_MG-2023]
MSNEWFADNPDVLLNLTEQTQWKTFAKAHRLSFSGRLIGGCIDTLIHFVMTEYCDLTTYAKRYQDDGVILYIENAEMSPTAFCRALLGLKYRGVFELVQGVIIGRHGMLENGGKDIDFEQALAMAFDGVDVPVVYDVDVSHLPPNLTLINGAVAQVEIEAGQASLVQQLV